MDQNSLLLPELNLTPKTPKTHSLLQWVSLETTAADPSQERKTQFLLLYSAVADPTMGFNSCMLLGFDRGYWTWVLIVHAPLFSYCKYIKTLFTF